jgi:digeranylgeranylglycerophospholipid reductase
MRVLVVGAGPAGLSAALNASREGHEVLVYEKNAAVGSKICGEALGRESLNYVDIKPSKDFIVREAKGFRITFKGTFIREAPFGNLTNAPGYLIDKAAFLNRLVSEAENSGAKVLFNTRVDMVNPKTGRLRLQTGEVAKGDLVICADGIGSVARRHLDYSGYNIAVCVQSRCSLPKELNPEYLHLDVIGEGYAWAFIKNDCANIGLGLPRNACSVDKLKLHLEKYMQRLGVKPLDKVMSAPVSIGGPIKTFCDGKMVVVGEAAGCVMPLSGEGIRFALYGGSIACRGSYRAEFMKKYGKNMEASKKIFQLARSLNDKERITLLNGLDDPLDLLEGNWPKIGNYLSKPSLLMKLMCRYFS